MDEGIETLAKLEARQIRQTLAQQQCKLERLSIKVLQARAVLDKLLAEEADAIRTRDACRALLSPVHCLPFELLSAIFVFCLPDDWFVMPHKRQAPLHLTQICSSWRAIALSTPQLWSSLRVMYHIKSRGKDRSKEIDRIVAPSMGLWLSRSGPLPLSISVEGVAMKQSILDVLFYYSTRCRHLELKSIHSWSSLQLPDGNFPILERLHVHSIVRQIRLFSSTFAAAPELHEVYWEDGSEDSPGLRLALPWAQLKHLTLGTGRAMTTSTGTLLDILASCPLLEYINVTVRGIHDVPPRRQILLPNVSSLTLKALSHHDDYTPMFTYLTTPRLRKLACAFGLAWPSHVFLSFINRSGCALDSLYLRRLGHLTQIAEYLQIVSNSVTCLSIHDTVPIITDELLNVLTSTPFRPCLCPNLEMLTLAGCISQSRGALAAMVRSRLVNPLANNRTAKLQKLDVLYREGDWEELCNLQGLGLILNTPGHLSDI